jgi:hypothetical protein
MAADDADRGPAAGAVRGSVREGRRPGLPPAASQRHCRADAAGVTAHRILWSRHHCRPACHCPRPGRMLRRASRNLAHPSRSNVTSAVVSPWRDRRIRASLCRAS